MTFRVASYETSCSHEASDSHLINFRSCSELLCELLVGSRSCIVAGGHGKRNVHIKYRVILSALDPRKCEYLKDYSLDFEHAYMTTYLAS